MLWLWRGKSYNLLLRGRKYWEHRLLLYFLFLRTLLLANNRSPRRNGMASLRIILQSNINILNTGRQLRRRMCSSLRRIQQTWRFILTQIIVITLWRRFTWCIRRLWSTFHYYQFTLNDLWNNRFKRISSFIHTLNQLFLKIQVIVLDVIVKAFIPNSGSNHKLITFNT